MNHKLLTLVTDVEYFLINSPHSALFTLHAHSPLSLIHITCTLLTQLKLSYGQGHLEYSNWTFLQHSSRVHFGLNMFKNSTNKDMAVTALYFGQVFFWRTPTLTQHPVMAARLLVWTDKFNNGKEYFPNHEQSRCIFKIVHISCSYFW